jgi:hypothetical protein
MLTIAKAGILNADNLILELNHIYENGKQIILWALAGFC